MTCWPRVPIGVTTYIGALKQDTTLLVQVHIMSRRVPDVSWLLYEDWAALQPGFTQGIPVSSHSFLANELWTRVWHMWTLSRIEFEKTMFRYNWIEQSDKALIINIEQSLI